jgi:hypothetical protein
MSTHCHVCGSSLQDNHCRACHERALKLGAPAVLVESDSFTVEEVRLDPVPGKVYPQPLSLVKAEAMGLVLTATEGNATTFFLLSARVRLVLKARKETT